MKRLLNKLLRRESDPWAEWRTAVLTQAKATAAQRRDGSMVPQPCDELAHNSTADEGIPISRTGLVSDLGSYAERGELFLTTRITGTDADRIREEMRPRSRLVTITHTSDFEPPEKLDPPVYFEPLPTDEVWEYTTSTRSWQNLAGRAGHALVRDGVVICETTTRMS
jgi:hypothetical protein